LFLTGSNVLADNFGDPKGSQFSDLVVKFYVGSQTYEGTILTNLSRELENNQFEVAVRVPDTLPLGGSRIVLGRNRTKKSVKIRQNQHKKFSTTAIPTGLKTIQNMFLRPSGQPRESAYSTVPTPNLLWQQPTAAT
jgi:hypothetical protein